MMPIPPPPPSDRKLRVLLCGYGHLGLALLQGLLAQSAYCDIVGVFRWSAKSGAHQHWDEEEQWFQELTHHYQLPDLQCKGMNSYEFTVLLQQQQPDVVLVGSWGEILKPHLLETPNILFVNCHPSLLPAHGGANPYASVILQNETETGVTFHLIVEAIDAGPILCQQSLPIHHEDNGETIRAKCAEVAEELVQPLIQHLYAHVAQQQPLEAREQDPQQRRYFPQLQPQDGELNWQHDEAALCRQMRGLFPWVACYSYLSPKRQIMLLAPYFVDRPPQFSQTLPAGTVLGWQNGALCIAIHPAHRMLQVSAYQIVHQKRPWPFWLNPLLAPWLLRPGKTRLFSSSAN